MKDRKKKIIALSLALTLLTGLSACKKKEMSLITNNETKQEYLTGNLYKEDLKYCYIVESFDKDEYVKLSLVYDKYNNKELYTKYGEIISIIPFEYFVNEYGMEKEIYTANDVEKILKFIKKNYIDLKESNKVNKLELKGKKIYEK